MRRLLVCLAVAVLAAPGIRAESFETAYWVWHRAQPLSAEEQAELTQQKVRTLYWSVGEVEYRGGHWRWKSAPLDVSGSDGSAKPDSAVDRPPAEPANGQAAEADARRNAHGPAVAGGATRRSLEGVAPGFHVVPVVRLSAEDRAPFAPAAQAELMERLRTVAGAGELQIDFDCPDRLLAEYASALANLRATVPHLSITALTHWPRLRDFPKLVRSVEEIAPMFYDMQADPTGVGIASPPPPLLDPEQIGTALRAWRGCPIPWRAGLPSFARLTVFDRTGLSRGQIPNWSWEDFCFHKNLRTLGPTHLGVTLFRADDDIRVARTPVAKDELVASRFVDRGTLAQVLGQAREAGAAGAIFFRLADGTDPAGWSAADLGALTTPGTPRLILRASANERLDLVNDSAFDLPARLSGTKSDRDRGYALEIDAPGPLFREALAGDFWRVTSHVNPDADPPVPVAVPLATRVTYWFSHLPAQSRLQTGLLQLAPGATLAQTRYRILNCEGATAWKPVQPPVDHLASP